VDEDDFRDRPRTRKEPRTERPNWELALLEQLRVYVLREPEDFIVRGAVAKDLNMTNAVISLGQCLAALVREGLLEYRTVDPKEYPEVFLHENTFRTKVTWLEDRWIWGEYPVFKHKGFGNYKRMRGIRRDPRRLRSKRAIAKAQRKNPPIPVKPEEWDGKAYFIVRGREFQSACEDRDMPLDPKADWTCPSCKRKNRYTELDCSNYGHCKYRRPHDKFWPPPPVQSIECRRCGATLPPGKKTHPEPVCNEIIVRGVMES
jgi:hypothetical protein